MGYGYGYGFWRPYVSVAERRRKAQKQMQKLKKQGHPVSPVIIEGRAIATTFWGKAWCDNIETYHDYENRLPRGRTYVRNGSVVDLQIAAGEVKARVAGSELYSVEVSVSGVPAARWTQLCRDCAQGIDSLVDLLQGRFSKGVMERLCRQKTGLFPMASEIRFRCSCPDWASMCKHVAATLYGVGARLDDKPELLFLLRQVDGKDLLASAGQGVPLAGKGPAAQKVLRDDGISELFGIELAEASEPPAPRRGRAAKPRPETPAAAPAPEPAGKTRSARPGRQSAKAKASRAKAPAKPAKARKTRAEAPGPNKASAAARGRKASKSRAEASAPAAGTKAARPGKPAEPGQAAAPAVGKDVLAHWPAARQVLLKALASKL
jgi:uncharacterized Zn finger protein